MYLINKNDGLEFYPRINTSDDKKAKVFLGEAETRS